MIQGHFDRIVGRDVCGWAWNPAAPHERVRVRVIIDGQTVAEGLASHFRPDLLAAGIGTGQHAFFIPLPEGHGDGRSAALLVVGDDDVPLAGTPSRVDLPSLHFVPAPPLTHPTPLSLTVCAIVRNEGPYLLEWIAHHRLVGVEHFVLFDNQSTDTTTPLLSTLAQAGIVDHVPWPDIPHVAAQKPAYAAGLARLDGRSRWVAFIDADEFLNPLQGGLVTDILHDYESAAGLMVPWRLFGSNGQMTAQDDLVTRRFTRRAPDDHYLNHTVKTIVQARLVTHVGIHTPDVKGGSLVDEHWILGGSQGHPDRHKVPGAKRLVVNHYFTKSRQEWQAKRSRGCASEVPGRDGWMRSDHDFTAHDINDVVDPSLADRADTIQAEMARLRALIG